MEIGIQFLASMLLGWFLGQWLSGGQWWAGLLGGLIGFIGAMWQIYKKSLRDIEEAKQARQEKLDNAKAKYTAAEKENQTTI